ncbi:hypothetical protein [Nocardia miyunensis]|uniref:hypothetical protein n=1 Tax=Nocardia miyunensis TaxID=282684 RepID=UPI0012F527B3|nr:hypothetical protein [Nocardia miyunensis]
MSDSLQRAHAPADADVNAARRGAIAVPAVLFVMLAAITVTVAPGSIGGRLLLAGVDGVCLAAFAALGLVVVARCKREDSVRKPAVLTRSPAPRRASRGM